MSDEYTENEQEQEEISFEMEHVFITSNSHRFNFYVSTMLRILYFFLYAKPAQYTIWLFFFFFSILLSAKEEEKRQFAYQTIRNTSAFLGLTLIDIYYSSVAIACHPSSHGNGFQKLKSFMPFSPCISLEIF